MWLHQKKKYAVHIILEEDWTDLWFNIPKRYLSCTGSIWAVKLHWLDKVLLYMVTDQDIIFLVPDSCWATEKNQEQYKHRHNSIPILLWWHKIVLKYDLCWHNVSCPNMWFINEIKTINFCTSLLQTYLIKHTPLTSLASESIYSLSIHITVLNYNQYLFLVNK
jgi:hypothetical protein